MKIVRVIAPLFALCIATAVSPAFAQIGVPADRGHITGFKTDERTKKQQPIYGNNRYGSVGLYPLASFARAGLLSGGGAGTATTSGGLVSVDFGLRSANARLPIEIGGWYWNSGNADLYQVHVRAFVTPEVALQVAHIDSSKVNSNSYTIFGIYELASRRVQPDTRRPWTAQFGAGLFFDATGGSTTTHFTTFAQGSVTLWGNLSLNASEWYVRDRSVDLNRFLLGIGYHF